MTIDDKEKHENVIIGVDPNTLSKRALKLLYSDSIPTPKEKKEFENGFDEAIVKGIEKQRDEERKIVPETDKQVERRKARLEALEFQLKEAKQQTDKKANVRKAVALEIAKCVENNKKDLTRREAAVVINDELKRQELETYHEKHLIRIIKCLDFKQGKSGRKPKK